MYPRHRSPAAAVRTVLLAASLVACAGDGSLLVGELASLAGLDTRGALDDSTIVAGLKEALRVGTDRTVSDTSRENGFLGNDLIRIPVPEELDAMTRGLRAIGLGGQVDELEVAMNRAAERAAAEATPVFVDAIKQMSFSDARAILEGDDHAATDYFQARTSTELDARFRPIVRQGMEEVGLVQLYEGLLGRIGSLPLVPTPGLDLDEYVTGRALDGLFTVLAQEEARIREDPAARSTELLRKVFGGG
jgi:hypothetical protein